MLFTQALLALVAATASVSALATPPSLVDAADSALVKRALSGAQKKELASLKAQYSALQRQYGTVSRSVSAVSSRQRAASKSAAAFSSRLAAFEANAKPASSAPSSAPRPAWATPASPTTSTSTTPAATPSVDPRVAEMLDCRMREAENAADPDAEWTGGAVWERCMMACDLADRACMRGVPRVEPDLGDGEWDYPKVSSPRG